MTRGRVATYLLEERDRIDGIGQNIHLAVEMDSRAILDMLGDPFL